MFIWNHKETLALIILLFKYSSHPYIYLILVCVKSIWWPNKWYHSPYEGVVIVSLWNLILKLFLIRYFVTKLVLSCLFLGFYHIFAYKLVLKIKTNQKVPNFYQKKKIRFGDLYYFSKSFSFLKKLIKFSTFLKISSFYT